MTTNLLAFAQRARCVPVAVKCLATASLAMMLSLSPVTAAAERKPDILRHSNVLEDQKFPGMDYRHFKVLGGAAECRDACRVESQCRAWTYNPSREVGGVRVPTCWLKSGIPQREYARGYVSGIKPPPPAVKADGGRPPLRRDEGSRTTPPPPISAR